MKDVLGSVLMASLVSLQPQQERVSEYYNTTPMAGICGSVCVTSCAGSCKGDCTASCRFSNR